MGRRWRRRRSRSRSTTCWATRCSSASSTPSTAPRRATRSSTGRPARRPRTPQTSNSSRPSSPCTGSPTRAGRASTPSSSTPCSTSSPTTRSIARRERLYSEDGPRRGLVLGGAAVSSSNVRRAESATVASRRFHRSSANGSIGPCAGRRRRSSARRQPLDARRAVAVGRSRGTASAAPRTSASSELGRS